VALPSAGQDRTPVRMTAAVGGRDRNLSRGVRQLLMRI
jgi:hypothetical protein